MEGRTVNELATAIEGGFRELSDPERAAANTNRAARHYFRV